MIGSLLRPSEIRLLQRRASYPSLLPSSHSPSAPGQFSQTNDVPDHVARSDLDATLFFGVWFLGLGFWFLVPWLHARTRTLCLGDGNS